MKSLTICLAMSTLLFATACNGEELEDRVEQAAEASAAAAGPEPVALGLSESQLIDADLIGPNKVEIGGIEGVVRNASGQVERLLVEIEDSNPDRFVEVPVAGLTTVVAGGDTDLATSMTKEQLAALPDADLAS